MLTLIQLVHRPWHGVCSIEVPEQCDIVCFKGCIFVRGEDGIYVHVDHLMLDGVSSDRICVIAHKNYVREAA